MTFCFGQNIFYELKFYFLFEITECSLLFIFLLFVTNNYGPEKIRAKQSPILHLGPPLLIRLPLHMLIWSPRRQMIWRETRQKLRLGEENVTNRPVGKRLSRRMIPQQSQDSKTVIQLAGWLEAFMLGFALYSK